MIPIFWRYLIRTYFKTFFLLIASFIAILFVSRFKEIAKFTALSESGLQTACFCLYQIPLILPLAIPIATLIASFLLSKHLSQSHEFTAFRASGISLTSLFTPLLLSAFLLGIINFMLCAELAPFCRKKTKQLLYQETSSNPLFLLQRQNLLQMNNLYLSMKVEKEGQAVNEFLCIAYNRGYNRLLLLSAKHFTLDEGTLLGSDVALLAHIPSLLSATKDTLFLEHQKEIITSAPLLSSSLKKNRPRLDPHSLSLKSLKYYALESKKKKKTTQIEMLRRGTLAVATVSFTLLGLAFGYEQGRKPLKKRRGLAMILTLSVLISYLFGKEVNSFAVAIWLLLLPHPFIWLISLLKFRQIYSGKLE